MSRRLFRIARARTGLGLLATRPIKKGALIVRYSGRTIPNEEAERREFLRAPYMYELNKKYTLDGSSRSNLGATPIITAGPTPKPSSTGAACASRRCARSSPATRSPITTARTTTTPTSARRDASATPASCAARANGWRGTGQRQRRTKARLRTAQRKAARRRAGRLDVHFISGSEADIPAQLPHVRYRAAGSTARRAPAPFMAGRRPTLSQR